MKDFKIKFRNPYSQANADIFNDINVRGKDVTARHLDNGLHIFLEKCFDNASDSEMPLRNIPTAQKILQIGIARESCYPYFQKVDEIIQQMLSNIKK